MSTKRTPAQIWRELEKEARDDEEIERVASLSDAALDAELAAAGFDVEKERAEARAVADELERKVVARRARQAETEARKASRRPAPARRPLHPMTLWIAAAIAAGAGGLVYALTHPSAPPPGPPVPAPSSSVPAIPEPPSERLIAASDLRKRAFAECAAEHWDACIVRFDDARRLDPAGDTAPEVQATREKAQEEIERRLK